MFRKAGDILETSNLFKSLIREVKEESCEKHGPYKSERIFFEGQLKYASTCPQCRYELWEKLDEEKKKFEKQSRIESNLRNSRIPSEYLNKGFQSFVCETDFDKKAYDLCIRFCKAWKEKVRPNGYGFLFYGTCGTGKTHLSTAILKALIEKDWTWGIYTNVRALIDHVRSTWNDYSDPGNKERVVNQYRTVPLLIIDEIGIQAGTENEIEILFSILDYRVTNSFPTILISNLNRKDLQSLLSERLYDRILTKCVPLQFQGKSKRKHLSTNEIPF